MAKRLLPPDFRVLKDNGDPATDATLVFKLGGTSTNTPIWYDPDLTEPTTSGTATVSCDATGFPASGGNDVSIWGADDVTYDVVITATGYNGGAAKTIENLAVADDATTGETDAALALGNAFDNGGLESWSNGTSFSNISGTGNGVVTADGIFVSQSTSASNAISRQSGFAVGDDASSRYCIRVGRPDGSTSNNSIRVWLTVKPEIAYRLRGQEVALRYSVAAGAGYSASPASITVRLATGTTESEDGDLIESNGFAGHVNIVSMTQLTPKGLAQRFEHIVTMPDNIKEVGFLISTGVFLGTATSDYINIQDIELKLAADPEEFHARPEALDFILSNLSTGGRLFAKTAFTAPGADRVMIWDDSAGDFVGATLGTGISISGTTISLDEEIADIAALTPTDGVFIVGDGTAFVTESGNTARTSLALGTGDSPTFNGLTLTSLAVSNGAAATTSPATFVNTNDNAGVLALRIEGDRATPANNDAVYAGFFMSNLSGTQRELARISAIGVTLTNGLEVGRLRFSVSAAGAIADRLILSTSALFPAVNDQLSIGISGSGIADIFLASGAVIDGNAGNATITHVTGGWEVGGTFRARTSLSLETSGTLTSASANRRVKATAGVTINDGVFTAEDAIEIYNDSDVSITITQDTGMTLRLAGTTSTGNRTLAARGVAYVYFDTNADAAVAGSGVS